MTTAQWERIKEVTADALELNPEARPEFVATACGDDTDVHREVLRLLDGAETIADDFLSSPPLRVPDLLALHAEPTPGFSAGQVLAGRFRIERFINRGGMGEVYAAMDLELHEIVALKTIRPAISYSAVVIDRFKREVSQSRRITHPNVCRVHDMFSHPEPSGGSLWFLTMELLDGRTLGESIAKDGPCRTGDATALVRDMVNAVAAAHALGIVHRDFKPNNVMLVKSGDAERAVVTDFGLALNLATEQAVSDADATAGTPAYMAPEQTTGKNVGFATDQYALGLVICELLTGKRPDLNRNSAGDLRRQLKAWLKLQPRRVIDSRLRKVIVRCLQFAPEDRFRDVRDILRVMNGNSVSLFAARLVLAACLLAALGALVVLALGDGHERVTDAVPMTAETGMAGSPSLSADGKWVAYVSDRAQPGNLDIWIQSAAGGQARRVTTDPAIDTDPAVSPDGRLVAFRSERNGGGLYVTGGDRVGDRLLAAGGHSPAFSPDGRWIVYWTGNRDDATPSGELFKISSAGGSPIRLVPDFADARNPAWNSNRQTILFEGCRSNSSALSVCTDWWVMQADGSRATNSGALALLKSQRFEVQTPPVKSWRGDEVIFSAARGPVIALWALTLSGSDRRPRGQPRQITAGEARERDPSVADTGTIAFGRATGALHVWRIPLGPDRTVPAIRVTNDAGLDGCPSVARNGRWLYFTRKTGNIRQLVVMDLSSGRESLLLVSQDDKFWPVSSPDGDRVVVETRRTAESSIWLVERNGSARKLCDSCSRPTSWSGDHAVFHTTSKGEIAELDTSSGKARIVLSPETGVVLGEADWNPTNECLLFTAGRHGGVRRVFAVRYPRAIAVPQGAWIPVSAEVTEMEQPHWSQDGRSIFFLSKRDGNNCIWGLKFDAAHHLGASRPFPVMHYHDPRLTPDRASPVARGLTVSPDSVILNIGEVTNTLWIGRLTTPPWLGWFDKLSFSR
jgi:Tol biopolymer transport system component